MVLFGLAREARDEGRADRHARDALAHLFAQCLLLLARHIATHQLQHPARPVLQRDVEVWQQSPLLHQLREGVDDAVVEVRRIGVHQAHPPSARLLRHRVAHTPQQLREALPRREARADVVPVRGRVLPDEQQLEGPVPHELAGLVLDPFERLGPHLAPDARDGAERAVLVAPLTDPQVRVVPGRQPQAGAVALEVADALAVLAVDGQARGLLAQRFGLREPVGADPVVRARLDRLGERFAFRPGPPHRLDDLLAVEDAEHRVHARHPVQDLRPVPLHEAARDDDPLDLPPVLPLHRLADHRQRFLLAGLKEPAGVDHDRVRGRHPSRGRGCVLLRARDRQVVVLVIAVRGRGDRRDPVLGEQPQHLLAVHGVLWAAETDERDRPDLLVGAGLGITLDVHNFWHPRIVCAEPPGTGPPSANHLPDRVPCGPNR